MVMFSESDQQADELARLIGERRGDAPVVVAIDGRSGVGKSTLATALNTRLGGVLIAGDDFYMGGVGLRSEPPSALAAQCMDWRAQKRVLVVLKQGQAASYAPFDWAAFDGSLCEALTHVEPRDVILLEGVYSARPELAALVDIAVLITLPEEERLRRLVQREGGISAWEHQWHRAEDWYFEHSVDEGRFDVVL